VKRSLRELAAGIEGMRLHIDWISIETKSNGTRRYRLIQCTADDRSEDCLGNALQRYLPSDVIFIDAVAFAATVRTDDACRPFFELIQATLFRRGATSTGLS
jgi:hypothetical protein